jgi:hypothetical protein
MQFRGTAVGEWECNEDMKRFRLRGAEGRAVFKDRQARGNILSGCAAVTPRLLLDELHCHRRPGALEIRDKSEAFDTRDRRILRTAR